jgi:hypothetical protein
MAHQTIPDTRLEPQVRINKKLLVVDDHVDAVQIDVDAIGVERFAVEAALLRKRDDLDSGFWALCRTVVILRGFCRAGCIRGAFFLVFGRSRFRSGGWLKRSMPSFSAGCTVPIGYNLPSHHLARFGGI